MNPRESEPTRDLLQRSMELRDDLNNAVGKLDAYIEQLRVAMRKAEGTDGASTR